MESLPADIPELVAAAKFPKPDNPGDPSSSTTLAINKVRAIGALIDALIDYIQVEYARCGKQATPSPSP